MPTAITFYKEGATVGADPIPVTITEKLYLGENVKFNYTTAPEGYTGAFLLDGKKYFFKITTAAGVPADYEYCKWEYTMGGVTKEIKSETTITSDVVFKATFDVKVSFVVSPTKTPAWGVIHDNNKNVVDHAYVTPGDNVKFTTANITLHEKDYYAVASQGCEFVSWSTDPASLEVAPTTPFKLIATFGQTPIVKFAIESSDGQKEVKDYVTITDKNGQVVDITKAVAGLKIGSKYALDSTKNTVLVIDEQTFTVTVNEHYVALGDYVWYLDKGASADTPVDTKATELKSEDNITLVAKAKRVDNLTATGTIECSNPEKATVRADVIMNAGSPDEAIVDTQFPTVGTDGKYVVNNVPLNVSIRVYVDNATHNVGDTKTEVKKDNVTIPTVKLTKDYSFSFGKLANKVWPSDNNSNKTITTSYGTQKEGYYNFAEGSKLVLNASKVGDTITFANLKGAVGGQIQIGNQTPIKFEGRFASGTIGADDVDSDGNVTITILAAVDVDLIAVHAVERVVTFAVDKAEGSYANGTFKKDGAEVKSVKVNGLGVTYSVTEDLLTFSDNQKVIATPDGKSLFRHWNVSGTDVLEDITISAKFVQEFVNVKFEKSSSSATDAEVPAAAQIHMDSVYQPNASYQSTILAKPSFVYDSVSTAFDVKVKEADQIMYKFAAKPFEDLTNGNTINEEKYPTIEKDGLTLKYITEKRSTYTVTIDLLGGNLVSPYTIPVVDSSLGGSGE